MKLSDAVTTTATLLQMDPEKVLGRALDGATLKDLGVDATTASACEIQAWRLLRTFEHDLGPLPTRAQFDGLHRLVYLSLLSGIRFADNPSGEPRYRLGRESVDAEFHSAGDLEAWVQARHHELDQASRILYHQ